MIVSVLFSIQDRSEERIAMQALLGSPELLRNAELNPKDILFAEIRRSQPSLSALGIGFSVSRQTGRMKGGRAKKRPLFRLLLQFRGFGKRQYRGIFLSADRRLGSDGEEKR
jgi:hypothetical protein